MRIAIILLGIALFVSTGLANQTGKGTQANSESHSAIVEVNGIELHYRMIGNGPVLLLLHGFSMVGAWWDPLLSEFATDYTVIVPDLPAHGHSTAHPGPYRYPQVAKDLFALLDQLEVESYSAIGFSTGGEVLLHMATQQPARIKAMCLISALHRLPEPIRSESVEPATFEDAPPEYQAYWLESHPGGVRQVRALLTAMHSVELTAGNFDFTSDQLSSIQARTLLITGDRDEYGPVDLTVELYTAIPEVALWVIPEQGHFAMWPDWGGSAIAHRAFPSTGTNFFAKPEQD